MKYLSDYAKSAQTALFDKTGAFFAFGNKQFKKAANPAEKYFSLGSGLFCPQKNYEELAAGLINVQKEAIALDVEENGAESIIQREYFNYESQISMCTTEASAALAGHIAAFPALFSPEKIDEIFKKCFQIAIENDWF